MDYQIAGKLLEFLIVIILIFLISYYVTDVGFEHDPKVINIFDSELYKLVLIILIICVSYFSPSVGILLGMSFVILLINIPKLMEKFNTHGPPLNNCNNYDKEYSEKMGGSFYPLNSDDNEY